MVFHFALCPQHEATSAKAENVKQMKTKKLVLRPKTTQTILLAAVCLLFIIGGIIISKEETLKGWLVISFFGSGLIVFLVQLVPGSVQLTLTDQGFIITSLFRSHLTKWSDIKLFKIGYLGRKKAVMFDFVDDYQGQETGKMIASALSGSHGALPGNYGLKIPDLLDMMNQWKDKYGS